MNMQNVFYGNRNYFLGSEKKAIDHVYFGFVHNDFIRKELKRECASDSE